MSLRHANLILFLLSFLTLAFLLDRYFRLRDEYYREYLKYKEVMLLLKNYQAKQKAIIDENYARQKVSTAGGELSSFKQTDTGYELKIKNLRGENLPRLIYTLESEGVEVLKLKAVDNTGEGMYEVELLIR
jgi:hypothetical protein